MLIQLLIFGAAVVFMIGSIGDKDQRNRNNYIGAFIACLAAIAIINIFN